MILMKRKRSALTVFTASMLFTAFVFFMSLRPAPAHREELDALLGTGAPKSPIDAREAVVKRSIGRKEVYLAEEGGAKRLKAEIRYGSSILFFDGLHAKKSVKEKLADVRLFNDERRDKEGSETPLTLLEAKSATLDFDTGEFQAVDVSFDRLEKEGSLRRDSPSVAGKAKRVRGNFLQADAGFEAEEFQGTYKKG